MIPADRQITVKAVPTLKWKDCPIQLIFTQGSLTRTFKRRVSSYKGFVKFSERCYKKMYKEGFCP